MAAVIISACSGCSEIKDASKNVLTELKDAIKEQFQDNNEQENTNEYETIETTIFAPEESLLESESEYIPYPETNFPLKYENEYFTVSPDDKWQCYDATEDSCFYVLSDPESIEEAGLVISIQVIENCGSNEISLHEMVDDMDEMFAEIDYKVVNSGDTVFQDREAYYITVATSYETHLIILAFQTEECYFTYNIAYNREPMIDSIKAFVGDLLTTVVIK